MADIVYPYTKFRYRLEIDGLDAGGFSEVTGFDASIDVVEYREGDMVPTPMKVQGLRKYGNVTLKWGLTSSTVLYDWLMEGVNGPVSRKTVTITAIDESADRLCLVADYKRVVVQVYCTRFQCNLLRGCDRDS